MVGLGVGCLLMVIVVLVFIFKYLLKKTIEITKIPNRKQGPQILGMENDIEEIEDNREDPYFGHGSNRVKPEP